MIAELIKDYLQLKFEAIIEKDIDKISTFAAVLAGILFLMISFLLFFLFSTFALALFLSEYLGKDYWGFLVLAFFYLLSGWIFWSLRNALVAKPLSKTLNKGFKDSFLKKDATN